MFLASRRGELDCRRSIRNRGLAPKQNSPTTYGGDSNFTASTSTATGPIPLLVTQSNHPTFRADAPGTGKDSKDGLRGQKLPQAVPSNQSQKSLIRWIRTCRHMQQATQDILRLKPLCRLLIENLQKLAERFFDVTIRTIYPKAAFVCRAGQNCPSRIRMGGRSSQKSLYNNAQEYSANYQCAPQHQEHCAGNLGMASSRLRRFSEMNIIS